MAQETIMIDGIKMEGYDEQRLYVEVTTDREIIEEFLVGWFEEQTGIDLEADNKVVAFICVNLGAAGDKTLYEDCDILFLRAGDWHRISFRMTTPPSFYLDGKFLEWNDSVTL